MVGRCGDLVRGLKGRMLRYCVAPRLPCGVIPAREPTPRGSPKTERSPCLFGVLRLTGGGGRGMIRAVSESEDVDGIRGAQRGVPRWRNGFRRNRGKGRCAERQGRAVSPVLGCRLDRHAAVIGRFRPAERWFMSGRGRLFPPAAPCAPQALSGVIFDFMGHHVLYGQQPAISSICEAR